MKAKGRKFKARNAREAAVQVLIRVYGEGAYSNLSLNSLLNEDGLAPEERSLAAALVYGTLSETEACDELLGKLVKRPLHKLDLPVLCILRMSIWQLYYSGQAEHAVVNEAVKMSRRFSYQSASGMVNAVLRNALRQYPDYQPRTLEGKSGFPAPLLSFFRDIFPSEEELLDFAAAMKRAPGMFMRFCGPPEAYPRLKAKLEAEGEVSPASFQPDGLYFKSKGRSVKDLLSSKDFTVQGESAMLPAKFLQAEAGETIFDLCAAPGGKTIQLAELSGGRAKIYAFELHEQRASLMARRFAALGLGNIETEVKDASIPDPALFGRADKVLADVPCSGLGLLASKPELRRSFDPEHVRKELLPLQAAVLDTAAAYLKPGGLLMYSTCTLNPEENEKQTEAFLRRHLNFRAEKLTGRAPETEAGLRALQPSLVNEMEEGRMTLWPHKIKAEGFFLALMRKDCS